MFNQKLATIAFVSTVSSVWCTVSFAQDNPTPPAPGGGTQGGGEPAGNTTTVPNSGGGQTTIVVQPPTQTTTTSTYTPYGPLPPQGYDPDKGLPSSSREAGTGGFDLPGAGATSTVRGGSGGSFNISGQSVSMPLFHNVRRGDTLWGLCDRYHQNPWAWPRVWSYNPQVENPHWIYPGDRIRLREGEEGKASQNLGGGFISRRSVVGQGTVFLRNLGYIEEGKRDVLGELTGSPDEMMLLTEGNDVYLKMSKDTDIRQGQEFTVFSPERTPEAGSARGDVINIKGTVKITGWDPKTKVARAKITESLDIMQRGDLIGPVGRRFDVVPPVTNQKEVWGQISGENNPRELIGQNQVIFVDKGSDDGLRPGNRLFVVRKGDPWVQGLGGGTAVGAVRMRYRLRTTDNEAQKKDGDVKSYPQEVIGEIRVLRTRPHSATCLVMQSDNELEAGDQVVARRGY
jgi:hypothetical protein